MEMNQNIELLNPGKISINLNGDWVDRLYKALRRAGELKIETNKTEIYRRGIVELEKNIEKLENNT